MKTIKNNKPKRQKLFNKYDKNRSGKLSQKQMITLIKNEYKDNHSKSIILSLMHIWGKKINGKYYITKDTFINKLYSKPDGFFRDKL